MFIKTKSKLLKYLKLNKNQPFAYFIRKYGLTTVLETLQ